MPRTFLLGFAPAHAPILAAVDSLRPSADPKAPGAGACRRVISGTYFVHRYEFNVKLGRSSRSASRWVLSRIP